MPHENVELKEKPSLVGQCAEPRGRFHDVDVPRLALWSGMITFEVLDGLIRPGIPEGGAR